MSYLDHIAECNRHDLAKFIPFEIAGMHIGWVARELARALTSEGDTFEMTGEGIALATQHRDFQARSGAAQEVLSRIARNGLIPALRGEMYAVATSFGAEPLMQVDRSAVPPLGVFAYGVHVNGFVRNPNGAIELWIGRRSAKQTVCPNQLDNMVAGGLSIGIAPIDNVVKEAAEEATVPEPLARTAKFVSTVRYTMERDGGLRRDTLFCYDLELPADFTPVNTDGEMASFRRLPAEEVKAIVRDTAEFKFNCNLVILDFMIRHGLLTEREADLAAIRRGMGQSGS